MRTSRLTSRVLVVLIAMTLFAAMASVAAAAPATMRVTSGGKVFTHAVDSSLVTSSSVVQTATVQAWVNSIASHVYCGAANATSRVDKKHKKITFTAAKIGYTLKRPESVTAIINELRAAAAAHRAPRTIALPTTVTKPKIMKLGKQILVVLSQRKIYLYNNNKIEKTYRCAVGVSRWPTPTGTFHIGKKVKNPSWNNGNASWSKNMPSHIGPGPNNPLGTRAMYVYTGTANGKDTGVRFHGVPHSEDSSIGHAASHGCMRMHRKDVENFFPRVSVGTLVNIIK